MALEKDSLRALADKARVTGTEAEGIAKRENTAVAHTDEVKARIAASRAEFSKMMKAGKLMEAGIANLKAMKSKIEAKTTALESDTKKMQSKEETLSTGYKAVAAKLTKRERQLAKAKALRKDSSSMSKAEEKALSVEVGKYTKLAVEAKLKSAAIETKIRKMKTKLTFLKAERKRVMKASGLDEKQWEARSKVLQLGIKLLPYMDIFNQPCSR